MAGSGGRNRRRHTRSSIALGTTIFADPWRPISGLIANISQSGALIECPVKLGGTRALELVIDKGSLSIKPIKARPKWAIVSSDGTHITGVEFESPFDEIDNMAALVVKIQQQCRIISTVVRTIPVQSFKEPRTLESYAEGRTSLS